MGLATSRLVGHFIHRQRPERVDGRQLSGRKVQGVVVGSVQLLPVGIDGINRIHCLLLRVAVYADHGGGHSVEIIVFQKFPRAENIAGGHFPSIYLLR